MRRGILFWKKAPFIKLLSALITGILLQYYLPCPLQYWLLIFFAGLALPVGIYYFPLFKQFQIRALSGLAILIPFTALGAIMTWNADIRNHDTWIGHQQKKDAFYMVTLAESPVEKPRSLKANAELLQGGLPSTYKGTIIIYFKKDPLSESLQYGSQILFKKELQEIKNPGNPGGFDYKRYCLFNGITHQVYLAPADYKLLPGTDKKWLNNLLEKVRAVVLSILREHIPGDREIGLAEALLIGYKNDLDKSLVQSYSNTGVVHIIAISGLHLGLIYWLLVSLLKPLKRKKYSSWLYPLMIVAGLWLFSLLAGAQPSILRSAVMFTCIVFGENLGRRTSIYNTLALSAFLLLCYNPFWLWDLGFQLSYSAVLSIVIFMKPVYNLLYIKNKLLDLLWKMNAVTIAAQILTVPISIYHFHQFPTLFLFTNFVAVPISSLILLTEIILCAIAFLSPVAAIAGKCISWLIRFMNNYIESMDGISFSVLDGLQITTVQVFLLYIFIAGFSYWLLEQSRLAIFPGLLAICGFLIIRCYTIYDAFQQQKIIVYNIPKHRAIDLLKGRQFLFRGDAELEKDDFVKDFHLYPARTLYQALEVKENLSFASHHIAFNNKLLLLTHDSKSLDSALQTIDLAVLSGNSRVSIPVLRRSFDVKQIVFDSSVPVWLANRWKKDCESLFIPYHDVSEKGAFVKNLN